MIEKPKVKFLTVIWGARYIEEFASVSLPSYLAAGNLPFMASETDFEIVMMTSMDSRDKFEERGHLAKLKALCPVRYILIDDLITNGNYGVTLTLAYARGIRDSGPEQTNTHFVFMNSDFVLADGSLRTLVAKIREGHRAIMAPSLRACSETVVPTLIEAVNQVDHTLTMSPRPMVQLAFDNLHPTVVGKTITQDFVTSVTHNQVYWQVDKKTLLGRYHLIFMLAIRPEVPMGIVNSYCDYGFVSELVPSGDFSIIDDSDGFFMLEIQSAAQEKSFLRCGHTPPDKIADELSTWTTREHRCFAEIDVVFRTGDLPAGLPEVRAEAARFVSSLHQRMGPPRDHVDHFYWTSGIQAWGSLKFPGEIPVLPPEIVGDELYAEQIREDLFPRRGLDSRVKITEARNFELKNIVVVLKKFLIQLYLNLLALVRRRVGTVPNVPIWHHLWLDSRLILSWIKSIENRPSQRNALVCDEASPLLASLRKHMRIERYVGLHDLIPIAVDRLPGNVVSHKEGVDELARGEFANGMFDNIFVHIRRAEVLGLRKILEWAENYIKPDGTIAVYIEHRNSEEDESNFSIELAQYIENLLPTNWIALKLQARFAGGRTKRRLRLSERFLFRFVWPSSSKRLPHWMFAVTLWPVVAALTALNNFRLRNLSSECPDYCSSAFLCLSNPPERVAADASPSEGRRTAA
ncbi:hypothetical protein [Bradyrhizobium sp.]|uniref:hypothetical protein n=1 Tax=Bradyrhizobium sp. TaxID=376 RepID=UPI004037682D